MNKGFITPSAILHGALLITYDVITSPCRSRARVKTFINRARAREPRARTRFISLKHAHAFHSMPKTFPLWNSPRLLAWGNI